jgi:hypothetical protein
MMPLEHLLDRVLFRLEAEIAHKEDRARRMLLDFEDLLRRFGESWFWGGRCVAVSLCSSLLLCSRRPATVVVTWALVQH